MSSSSPTQQIIDEFKLDLDSLPIREIVRKYISTGEPIAFSSSDYFSLRRDIAHEFSIHPNNIVVVGSTRVGFSLNPSHRFREVHPKSDIDVAIVSPERFDDYWNSVFEYSRTNPGWRPEQFRKALFKGWIDPRTLPNSPIFNSTLHWASVFDNLMASRRFGIRSITARLYRSWERLEQYQEISVLACRNAKGRKQ